MLENISRSASPFYNTRSLYITKTMTKKQSDFVNKIIDEYNNRKLTALLYGESGNGKSTATLFLANKLNASIYRDYLPYIDGHKFNNIYNEIKPTCDNPAIIVIEEID